MEEKGFRGKVAFDPQIALRESIETSNNFLANDRSTDRRERVFMPPSFPSNFFLFFLFFLSHTLMMDDSLFLCYGVRKEKGPQSLVHLGGTPMKEIF
jgi:hypothetical protein